jgi:hypothetical protein
VIADMMFGRGGSARDRAIIRGKLRILARRGLGGWWRIVKNSARYLVRGQERPLSSESWTAFLEQAGFTAIKTSALVAEAGLVAGARPSRDGNLPTFIAGAAANWCDRR